MTEHEDGRRGVTEERNGETRIGKWFRLEGSVILFSPPARSEDNLKVGTSCYNEPYLSLVLRSANLQSLGNKTSWKHFNYVDLKEIRVSCLLPCLFSLVNSLCSTANLPPCSGKGRVWHPETTPVFCASGAIFWVLLSVQILLPFTPQIAKLIWKCSWGAWSRCRRMCWVVSCIKVTITGWIFICFWPKSCSWLDMSVDFLFGYVCYCLVDKKLAFVKASRMLGGWTEQLNQAKILFGFIFFFFLCTCCLILTWWVLCVLIGTQWK